MLCTAFGVAAPAQADPTVGLARLGHCGDEIAGPSQVDGAAGTLQTDLADTAAGLRVLSGDGHPQSPGEPGGEQRGEDLQPGRAAAAQRAGRARQASASSWRELRS